MKILLNIYTVVYILFVKTIFNFIYIKINILFSIYIYIYTVKPFYKKLFFCSNFFLIERFSYKEVFTFPMILRINL